MTIKLIAIDIDGTLLNEKTNWLKKPLTPYKQLRPKVSRWYSAPADL